MNIIFIHTDQTSAPELNSEEALNNESFADDHSIGGKSQTMRKQI